MHRAILEDCLPFLIALVVSFGLLRALTGLCGARFRWGRFGELHDCQAGGVQSLATVLTLPLFLMIVLFIVQVSQLMIGMITVNYAAFAGARAAAVWLPAQEVAWDESFPGPENFPLPADPWFPFVDEQNRLPDGFQSGDTITGRNYWSSAKSEKIFLASAFACTSIAPSRSIDAPIGAPYADAMHDAYVSLTNDRSNSRMEQRIRNKIAYCLANTEVTVTVDPKDSETETGPTYNPRGHDMHVWPGDAYEFIPNEVGWQDAVTVRVTHDFAMLPGPANYFFWDEHYTSQKASRFAHRDGFERKYASQNLYIPTGGLGNNDGRGPAIHEAAAAGP